MADGGGIDRDEADDALWAAYEADAGVDTRNALAERYLGLVHHVAHRVYRQVGGGQEQLEEMIGAGTFGLLQAIASFQRSMGHQFSTFAVRRINGAILDDLRAQDWAPRSHRALGRVLQSAERKLIDAADGARPSVTALAVEAGVTEAEVHRYRQAEAEGQVVSLDDSPDDSDGRPPLGAIVGDSDGPDALDRVVRGEQAALLQSVIAQLPPRERTVVVLHYYENLSFRQIAALLYVHETRISQLHASAKKRLRTLWSDPDA